MLEGRVAAADCGMKYLPRPTVFGKLEALCKDPTFARAELES